jgi:predicted enzyme related to lactoylglutathione lyase
MIKGLRTVIYYVADLAHAKAWWTDLLGFGPYFDEPFYVGFNVGGYELGLHPGAPQSGQPNVSVVTYWGVADITAAFERLRAAGAVEHEPITEVGGDIRVASVFDPFGNVVGIIENPHFSVAAAE